MQFRQPADRTFSAASQERTVEAAFYFHSLNLLHHFIMKWCSKFLYDALSKRPETWQNHENAGRNAYSRKAEEPSEAITVKKSKRKACGRKMKKPVGVSYGHERQK
jgi:hypothetical protein